MINTVAQGVLVATGLSRWMGCSDPQGSGRGRESINPWCAGELMVCRRCAGGPRNLSRAVPSKSVPAVHCIFLLSMFEPGTKSVYCLHNAD